jgi:hypothetical protein
MTSQKATARLTGEILNQIMEMYSQEDPVISQAYNDGGLDPLWARFERAVSNQLSGGEATLPRYAIWANTVRDNIVEAVNCLEKGDTESTKKLLYRAINSMSAFSEVQAYFDPFGLGKTR